MKVGMEYAIKNPSFQRDLAGTFAEHAFMGLMGARLERIEPGLCEIHLDWRTELTQPQGLFHGGAIAALVDVCGGFAAHSLLPPRHYVLTVEYKLNIIAPGDGEQLIGVGRVLRAGRTLIPTEIRIEAVKGGARTLCAVALQTMMGRPMDPEMRYVKSYESQTTDH